METLTRPPQTPVQPRSIADAPRRWPARVAVATVVILLALTLGGYTYLRSYQPLTIGTGAYSVWPHRVVVASLDAYGGDGDFRQSYVRWARGETVHMQFPLWNEGRLPVTVEGPTGSQMDRQAPIKVEIVGTGSIAQGQLTTPFAPFVLQPGQGVQVFVDVTMMRTVDRHSGAIVNTIDLDYRAMRMTHHMTLFIGQSLYLCGGPCPP